MTEPKVDKRKLGRERRKLFQRTRRAEIQYLIQLMKIARQCETIFGMLTPESDAREVSQVIGMLERYAEVIEPWARARAKRMIADVARRDFKAWMQMAQEMGRSLRQQIEETPLGRTIQVLVEDRTQEILSIPRSLADKVKEMSMEAMITGARTSTIIDEILKHKDIPEVRARMIARLGVGMASSAITEARARHVGSEGYIWRTTGGPEVRKDHRILNGKFFRWDEPPVVDQRSGYRSHPGCNAGCMCFEEVVLPAFE